MGLYFLAYNKLQYQFGVDPHKDYHHLTRHEVLKKLYAGGFGGQICWFLAYPFDAIKSYIQLAEQRVSMLSAAKALVKARGYSVFYRGLTPCLTRAFPVGAICLTSYDFASTFLDTHIFT
jgi:solute carrier family 25 carnitine/acylcarnitine transporter 20/29